MLPLMTVLHRWLVPVAIKLLPIATMVNGLPPRPHRHAGASLRSLRDDGRARLASHRPDQRARPEARHPHRRVGSTATRRADAGRGHPAALGLLHGGATCALVETVGSYAAAISAGPDAKV